MVLEWDTKYSVKVAEIDEQHQRLFSLVNSLGEAIDSRDVSSVPEIFTELIAYTQYHFSTEEKYFDKFNYPETFAHKEQHRLFAEKVTELEKKFKKADIEVTYELIDFLEDWLVGHVMRSDQKYVACFTANGLK
jgi:hemerythrin